MTDYLLSIDPGLSTGVALVGYGKSSVWLEHGWQFQGGVVGFLNWNDTQPKRLGGSTDWWMYKTVIAEKFQPISHSNYALTTASVEPLRVEGAMIALGLLPDYDVKEKRWRPPTLQYAAGGKSKPEKKKRLHGMLKDSGFYRTGKDFGTSDADDFRSACGHALSYLMRELNHKPTFDMMTEWSERNG